MLLPLSFLYRLLLLFVLPTALLSSHAHATGPDPHTDWQVDNNPDNICGGYYVQPPLPSGDVVDTPLSPIFIDAEEGSGTLGKGAKLKGKVRIVQGKRSLYSEAAFFDQASGDIELTDGATYREPGVLLTGKWAESNAQSLNTSIYDATYTLHDYGVRGKVEKISRNNDNETILIENGTYTQCPPGSEAWMLDADSILLDPQKGFGLAKHTKIRIGNIPVLYVPFFYFPIDDQRRTGFLYPTLRYSSSDGLDISQPYYFNIAPNIDDTLTPRIIFKRGLMLDNEFRYMNIYSTNTLRTAFLPDDRKDDRSRWLLSFKHRGDAESGWHSFVDYLAVSDNDYPDDFGGTTQNTSTSHLNRYGTLNYYSKNWQAGLLLQSYQTIDESLAPYRRLPQLSFTGTPDFGSANLSGRYYAEFTRFERDLANLTGANRVIGNRLHLTPQLEGKWQTSWGYIKPRIKYWYTAYDLENQLAGRDDQPQIAVPILSLDTGLYFDRDISLLDKTYQNTLEPRLFFLYVPEKDQSDAPDFDASEYSFGYRALFRDNRFSGYDRIGDTQQVSLGITSRLIDTLGRETLTASIGQAYYFTDRQVTLNGITETDYTASTSDLATSIHWRPNKRFSASFEANFDQENFSNSDSNFAVRYQEDINHITSLSYRYSKDERNQSTLSFIWPISRRWSTLGVWQHDWLNKDNIDSALGLEYDSCCWKTRLIARRWLKDNNEKDNAFYLQFTLKGLGGFGSSGGSEFVEKITGFEQREKINDKL